MVYQKNGKIFIGGNELKKIKVLGITLLSLLVISGCGNNEKDQSNSKNEATTKKAEDKSSSDKSSASFENDILTTKEYTIKIISTEIMDGSIDPKVLVIKYEFTNNTEEPTSPSIAFGSSFKVNQELDNTIETLYSSPLSDMDLYKEEQNMAVTDVKPSSTVTAVNTFGLKEDGKPVTVTVTESYVSEDSLGEFTVETK